MKEFLQKVFQKKRTRILIAAVAAAVLVIAFATSAFAEQTENGTGVAVQAAQSTRETQLLSELEPNAFPAEGKANTDTDVLDAPGGEAAESLASGDSVEVTDYVQGYFIVKTDAGTGYVAEGALDVTFAKPVAGEILQDGQAMASKTASEDNESAPLAAGFFVNIAGYEDGWWVIETFEDEPAYAKADLISLLPNIAARFGEPGEYGADKVEVIEGSAVISADVTLKNMVIEGNLYILDGVDKVGLNDAYVSKSTIPLGDVEIENNMTKVVQGVGSPSEITSGMFRDNYPEADVDQLLEDAEELTGKINDAVYAD